MKRFEGSGVEQRMGASPEIKNIRPDDIREALPPVGGTDIVLQRHGEYVRDVEDTLVGSLTPEAQERVAVLVRKKIETMLDSDGEDGNVAFLVTGSPTRYHEGGQRSLETAEIVRSIISSALTEHGLDSGSLLNNRSAKKSVATIKKVEEPRFLDERDPYFQFLLEKHGGKMGQDFWTDFEADTYRDERIAFGSEGPDEIDARFVTYVNALKRFAESFHKDNPNSRLVIWNVSHYDTISPFIKRHVDHSDKDRDLPVEHGGGITLELRSGQMTTEVGGNHYEVD